MRILIIHPEARSFAGAERVLEYFLQGIVGTGHEVAVAVAADTQCAAVIPKDFEKILIPDNGKFSPLRLCRELVALHRHHRCRGHFAVVHAWAARDWELGSLLARTTGCPAIGTLHDHPHAGFISKARQHLMRSSVRLGLKKIACVSHAVRAACLEAGYPAAKIGVVHNGLPSLPSQSHILTAASGIFRLGFLGVFSERKGLRSLFEIIDQFAATTALPWELHLAGAALDKPAKQMMAELEHQFAGRGWWRHVQWHGWLNNALDFLASLNLLICPSAQFDPFPTVLLESARVGVPALAAHVGGVAEIVLDNDTGWLFEPGNTRQAALILKRLLSNPASRAKAGEAARVRVVRHFSVDKMVADYLKLYSTLRHDV